MKTKEAIIDSLGTWDDGGDRYPRSEVEKAMDEYAKQQALAFDVYKREQHYILEHARNQYMRFGAAYVDEPRLSPDQLYAQFIEQQLRK